MTHTKKEYVSYIHGSEDSTDMDIHLVVDAPMTKQEARKLTNSFVGENDENWNVISIKDGVVEWSFKGAADEANNALLMTYHLHNQHHPLTVTRLVERNLGVKLVRTVRGMLGQFTRTLKRATVKEALRSKELAKKIEVLRTLKPSGGLGERCDVEGWKFLAFQMGQLMALVEGEEYYTKSSMAKKYPELEVFLYREFPTVEQLEKLDAFWVNTINVIESITRDLGEGLISTNAKWLTDIHTEEDVPYTITDGTVVQPWTDEAIAGLNAVLSEAFNWVPDIPDIDLPDLSDLPNPFDLLD